MPQDIRDKHPIRFGPECRFESISDTTREYLVLPYALGSESMGTTFGVGGKRGYGQNQLLIGGTVFGSSDEDAGLIAGMGLSDP